MICNKVKELMGAYISGDASAEESQIVCEHVEQCAECREDLRDRIALCENLDDAALELTEEERSRIKWYVKGAIGKSNKPKMKYRPKLAPVLAMAILVLVGFAFGRLIGTQQCRANDAAMRPHLPVLTVQQTSNQESVGKKNSTHMINTETEDAALVPAITNSETISPTAADYFRSLTNAARDVSSAGLATTRAGIQHQKHRVIVLEQSVPLDIEMDNKIMEEPTYENKLPEPNALNNAETTAGSE